MTYLQRRIIFQLHLLITTVVLLTGCSGPTTPAPAAISSPRTYISPAVPPDIREVFLECMAELPHTSPQVFSAVEPYPDLETGDLFLWWGNPQDYQDLLESDALVYRLRDLTLTLTGTTGAPQAPLTPTQARAIFTGSLHRWPEVNETLPPEEIEIWVLPENHPVQFAFEKSLLQGQAVTQTARIAPGLMEIQEAVLDRAGRIGPSIKGWGDTPSQEILIEPLPTGFQLPLLLIFSDPLPPDQTRNLISCLSPALD